MEFSAICASPDGSCTEMGCGCRAYGLGIGNRIPNLYPRGAASHLLPGFARSVVFLVANVLPVPSQRLQQISIGADHLVQTTNIRMHVRAPRDDSWHVLLHISARTLPVWSSAA